MKRLILIFLLICSPVYGGVDLDGSDDRLNCGDIDLNVSTSSMSAWVKFESGANGFVVNKDYNGVVLPYSLNVGGNDSPINIDGSGWFSGSWKNSGLTTDLRDGTWHHVVGTWDKNATPTLAYYVDGVLDSSSSEGSGLDRIQNNEPTYLGRYDFSAQTAKGQITEVALWNIALTAVQVANLASRVKRVPLQIGGGLEAYWPLDDQPDAVSGDGKTFMDLSGNGNHCTGDNGANNTGLTGKAEEALSYP